jgi:hypothetical protein
MLGSLDKCLALRAPLPFYFDRSTGRFDCRGACTGTTSRTLSRLAAKGVWVFSGNFFESTGWLGAVVFEVSFGSFM